MTVVSGCNTAETDAEVERLDLDAGAHLRSLLETELTVANDNYTYPNTTLDVRLLHLASSLVHRSCMLASAQAGLSTEPGCREEQKS